jgi:BirA family transcriptional regulator, biotin operon repressor / biotin---[acetyl-CoA-carboxylase] ligase
VLDAASLARAVREAGIDVPPAFLAVTGSTNTDIARLAERGAPGWMVVAAGEQTEGRGRLGRSWFAPAGGSLALSVLVRPEVDADTLPILGLAAGVAMAEACQATTGVDVRCKWPNDLVVGGRKLGGILCEAAMQGGRPLHVAVGVGVNVRQGAGDLPEELRTVATSLSMEGAEELEAGPLVAGFLSRLRDLVGEDTLGLGPRVLGRYRALCVTIGRRVRATGTDGAVVEGEAVGVDDSGSLLVQGGDLLRPVGFGEVQHLR